MDGVSEEIYLGGWKLHSPMQAIKDPAQDFFAGGPDALPIEDKFLVGDGVLPIMSCGRGGWENLVDGMEQGSAVVAENLWVG